MCCVWWFTYYLLTYLLTPWCRVILDQLTGLQLVKKFPAFYGTRRFTTALTAICHLSLSWASPIHSIYPHPTSWRSILILSTHLCLGLPSGLFPSSFPTKTLYTPLSSLIRATCPAHLILLDLVTCTILGEEYESFSSSLCNLLHYPVPPSSKYSPQHHVPKHPQLIYYLLLSINFNGPHTNEVTWPETMPKMETYNNYPFTRSSIMSKYQIFHLCLTICCHQNLQIFLQTDHSLTCLK